MSRLVTETAVDFGRHRFGWSSDWAASSHDGASPGWAHHGVAVTHEGSILVIAEDRPDLLVYDQSGDLLARTALPMAEGHGLTLDERHGPWLWVADPGFKSHPSAGSYLRTDSGRGGGLVRCRPDGSEAERVDLRRLRAPARLRDRVDTLDPAPTDATLDHEGQLWVADGYGSGLVLILSPDGDEIVSVIDGTEGAGRFEQPHGIHRHGDLVLVADRRRARIQTFDLEGRFEGVVQLPSVSRPSSFASWRGGVLVTDLTGSVWELDSGLEPIARWGAAPDLAHEETSWPNQSVGGSLVRPTLTDGQFRAPHSIATWRDQVFVTEWIIGGRLPRLRLDTQASTPLASSSRTVHQARGAHA